MLPRRTVLILLSALLSCTMTRTLVFANTVDNVSSTPELFAGDVTLDNLPDNWYAWNLLRKDENFYRPSVISNGKNWGHNSTTPDATTKILEINSVTLAFFKPTTNGDSTKNYMYSTLKLDFTPLTLGGLYVEAGAVGTISSLSDPSKIVESSFSIVSSASAATRYLNILSKEDQDILNEDINNSGKLPYTPVTFTINNNFAFGEVSNYFSAVNIYSSWNLDIASDKTFSIFGEMVGGKDKTITLAKGGTFLVNSANSLLQANWLLKDNSTLLFSKSSSGLNNSNLLRQRQHHRLLWWRQTHSRGYQ